MQVIQELTINNHKVALYDSVQDPLFDAKQIIETLLEYNQLEDSRFYKDNKENKLFIIAYVQPTGVSPDGQKGIKGVDNQYSNQTIYLTEFGLYECLFASKKAVAKEFRLQVITLLKDLRIGNLKLVAQRECETTKLLDITKQSLFNQINKSSELQAQILELQVQVKSSENRLAKAQEEISIYELQIDDKRYVGSSNQIRMRLKKHRSNSSNPDIRRAYSQGLRVQTRVLHTQTVTNRHERNAVERAFIQRVPVDQRLNKVMPRVRDQSLVSEECKQELELALIDTQIQLEQQIDTMQIDNDGLTTIAEVNDNVEDKDLKTKLLSIKEFIPVNGQYPLQKGTTPDERSLAMTVQYLRRGRKGTIHQRGKLIGLKESTIKLVNEIIPDFVWANHKSKYELTEGVSLVKQKNPQKPDGYNRITDDQFKQALIEFITENPRKLRDKGSGQIETKLYKKIKNLNDQRTSEQLEQYFGAELYIKLKSLGMV